MRSFHHATAYVAVALTGLTGLWGVALAATRRPASPPFGVAAGTAIVVVLVQVAAGLVLRAGGTEPPGLHLFYGVIIVFTLALAYVYRAQLARRPALSYGPLLLFVMGLAIRAWIG